MVWTAVSNTFSDDKDGLLPYRGMLLQGPAQSDFGTNRFSSNGLTLFPLMGPITNVPLSGGQPVSVPYYATFHLTTEKMDLSHTKFCVLTLRASVDDGKEPGVHGGWANHRRDVPPVRSEEESIISAVSNALARLQNRAQ